MQQQTAGFFFTTVLAAAVVLVVAPSARADIETVVVVYTPPSPLLLQLNAELRTAGFVPISIEETEDAGSPLSLAAVAASVGAAAAVRILRADKGVLVFVVDSSSRMNVSTEVTPSDEEERADAVVAIKAVEILRAGLIKIKIDSTAPLPAPRASPVPIPVPVRAVPAPSVSVPRMLLFVAPAVTYGFGGISPALHVALGLSLRTLKRLRIVAFGFVPTFAAAITEDEGSAEVREGMAALGITADLTHGKHRVIPFLGLEGGVLFFMVEGRADDPFFGQEKTVIAGAIHLDAGAAVRLNRVISLRGDLLVGLIFPAPVIRFDGREIASFGRPMLLGLLGIEATLF